MGKLAALTHNTFAKPYAAALHGRIALMAKSAKPHVLLIPLASNDEGGYISAFTRMYRDTLGCPTQVLLLGGSEPDSADAEESIAGAELIFVGGGENFGAIVRIKKLGIANRIAAVFEEGAVVAGEGVGAAFLFEGGFVDSLEGIGNEAPILIMAQGIGLVQGLLCPDYQEEKRQQGFAAALLGNPNIGFGITQGCALLIEDDRYQTIAYEDQAGFYRLRGYESHADVEDLFALEPAPLASMYPPERDEKDNG